MKYERGYPDQQDNLFFHVYVILAANYSLRFRTLL